MNKSSNGYLITEIKGIPVYLFVKKVKNINVTIKSNRINVSAPRGIPIAEIKSLLEKNYFKIIDRLEKVQWKNFHSKQESAKTVDIFSHFYLFGQEYAIEYRNDLNNIEFKDNKLYLPSYYKELDYETYIKNIDNFVKSILIEFIDQRLEYWYEKTGLKCSKYFIRKMKTRWGSCTYDTKRIRYNLLLALYPKDTIDCIIIHELCHLKVPNHHKEFYDLVYKYDPDYDDQHKVLTELNPPENFIY